jgi:prepilin-type N-terminal cleavage/methylation domain-containing protein
MVRETDRRPRAGSLDIGFGARTVDHMPCTRAGRPDDRGFTLVEILIAIVLVGILSAVVVVGVGNLTSKGSSAACAASADAIRTGLMAESIGGTLPATLTSAVSNGSIQLGAGVTLDSGGRRVTGNSWQLVYTARNGAPELICSSTTTAAPLDQLPVPPSAAYGLRRLSLATTGPLVRVRRSSDNTESDIGTTSAGDLDTAALLSFAGAGSAFVTTWYDQSGNGRHATQTTTAAQPRLVNNGVVETKNGRPAIRAHVNSTHLSTWKFAAPNTAWTMNVVASSDSTVWNVNNAIGADGGGSSVNGLYLQIGGGGIMAALNAPGAPSYFASGWTAVADGQAVVGTVSVTSGNVGVVATNGRTGTPTAPITWTTGQQSGFRIGSYPPSASISMLGTYAELISFPATLATTDRQLLERDQGTYFSITVV